MKKDINEPYEHNTHKREPLWTIVYAISKKGQAISYQRVYNQTYKKIQLILETVKDFYSYNGEGYEGKAKINIKKIVDATGLNPGTVSTLVVKLASCKRFMYKKGDKWFVERDTPFLIIQQKSKHVSKEFWGKKTPVYIFPFEERFYQQKE